MSLITGDEEKKLIKGEAEKNSGGVGSESLNSQVDGSQFTPGPWAVADMAGYPTALGVGVEGAEHALAVLTLDSNGDANTQMANARLIAAAPALYEALNEIVSKFPNPPAPPVGPEDGWFARPEAIHPTTIGEIRRARAALALVSNDVTGFQRQGR